MPIQIAHDTEIYQNLFSVVFRTIETNTKVECVIFEDRDDREKLRKIIRNNPPILIGWNSISFDIPILQAVLADWPVYEVWKLAHKIITSNDDNVIRGLFDNYPPIETIDVKRLMGIDTGLKQALINIQWPWIQELPFDPMQPISRDQVEFLLKYNDNDTLGTRELFLQIQGDIELRKWAGPQYNVNVINSSESSIANKLLTKDYHDATGRKPNRSEGTHRPVINLGDCIGNNIEFNTTIMNSFVGRLKDTQLILNLEYLNGESRYDQITKFNPTTTLNGVKYQLGVGGLHSVDKPGYFVTDDRHSLIDCDVTSFYPYIILINKIKPAHVDPIFFEIFKGYVEARIGFKASGDALAAWILKIVINSIFGKYGAESFWLYDPLAMYSVTISGQLYLLDLAEKLHDVGAHVVSANTDGLLCKVPNDRIDEYNHVCKLWQDRTKFSLEFETYEKYARRDVNNYIAKTQGGKFKTKGCFFDLTGAPFSSFTAGRKYNMPIVQKALKEWFDRGTDPKDFIARGHNIYDFLISQKPGKQFDVEYGGKQVQHVNRYYVSNDFPGVKLMKVDKEDPERVLSITTEPVTLLNDVGHVNTDGYDDLNLDYYVNETKKIINKIKPRARKRSIF